MNNEEKIARLEKYIFDLCWKIDPKCNDQEVQDILNELSIKPDTPLPEKAQLIRLTYSEVTHVGYFRRLESNGYFVTASHNEHSNSAHESYHNPDHFTWQPIETRREYRYKDFQEWFEEKFHTEWDSRDLWNAARELKDA